MDFHMLLWDSVGFCEFLSASSNFYGLLSVFVGFCKASMDVYMLLWPSMGLYGFLWASMGLL